MVPKIYNWIFLITFLSLPFYLFGQTLEIAVKDDRRTPLAGATVQLQSTSDSIWYNRIADLDGMARFERLSVGFYNLRISYIGYETHEKAIAVTGDEQRFDIILRGDAIALGEVTVTATRPLIRQEGDRMIIDPEPLASVSTNTLEILESTPGLFVDQDGGIYLSSATPATILINGREQKMSNQDITTLLRSLPPNSVQRIEVMRNPSARYSASSSGGIINIVLKRGARIGRFGSVNSGFNQGYYGNRFAGVSFNNGGNLLTSYINLNYNNNDGLEELNSARFLRPDTTLFQSARTRRQAHQAFVGYGLSMDPGEKWSLSYDGRVNGSLPNSRVRNNNLIAASDAERISETHNRIANESKSLNIQQDFGIRYRLDTLGSDWDTRLGYNFSRNDVFQDYSSGFIFPVNPTILGDGNNDQQRHFVQLQSDLTLQLPWKIRMEAGASSSWQDYDSRSDFRINLNGNQFHDPIRTNAFNYSERIHAAYLQTSRPLFAGITAKGGFRLEYTFMEGNQTIPADTSFVVERTDWFPYLYLSRPLFQIAGFEITSFMIYRRSINRPGYQSLNPYINYVDQFLYETGNPALKPQFTENFEFNISLNDMPIFAVGRSNTRDIFSSVIYRDPKLDNVAVRTFDNLGESTETYFRAIAGIPPGGRYFFAFGGQYNHNEYNGVYEGEPLSFSRGSWRFFTFHMLRLGSNTRLTMSGFMMTRGQMNFIELGTFGQLNLGLNQTFLDRKLTVSISARDVLRTMVTEFQLNQGSISTTGDRYSDNQRFGINIRYNFGIPDRQERRNFPDFDMAE